ncbi:MAG: hypothetical protein JO250_22945 [Armatimonadetes bacterium]|nr:hypothetical protein [Armatimonadota bacterium]
MSHRDHGSPVLSILLAVAVIAVAVLFPILTTPRSPSRIDACLWNEKGIGLALVQYAQDNDGQLPDGTQGEGEGWGGQVFPYIKDARTYRCYEDETAGAASSPVVSYGYNANAARQPLLGKYASPAHTVLVFEVAHDTADVALPDEGASQGAVSFSAAGDGTDGTLRSGRGGERYATGLLGGRTPAEFTDFDEPRHGGGANYLLADGHVRWLQPQDVSGGTDAARPRDPQMGATRGTAAGTGNGAYKATFSWK